MSVATAAAAEEGAAAPALRPVPVDAPAEWPTPAPPAGGFSCGRMQADPDPLGYGARWFCALLRRPTMGHHYVLCALGGRRVLLGPHWPVTICISYPILFLCTAGFLGHSGGELPAWAWAVTLALAVLCCVVLSLTACSDPGIVRPGRPHPDADQERGVRCRKCDIVRPAQAFHCDDCGVCVEELDHHCPWTGHCIGRRNIVYFNICVGVWIGYCMFLLFALLFASLMNIDSDD